jgi:release factor glutamine methyltransferase
VKISIRYVLTRGAARLQAAGIESARLDARILFSWAMGISSDNLFFAEMTSAQVETFDSLIGRRAAREPLAYITGRKEFWSLEFDVGPGVLIPRPETETLIEEALSRFPDVKAPLRVLDIGTGSGCLLIAFLKERARATGLGIDTSSDALAYARRNAARHDVSVRCDFAPVVSRPGRQVHQGSPALEARNNSWWPGCLGGESSQQLRGSACQFDVILANPPYLTDEEFAASAPEIRDYEPQLAFAAGHDGLAAFRAFLPLVAKSLSPAGMAFLEIGLNQADRVSEIVMNAGLEIRGGVPDLCGIPRCLGIGRAGVGLPLAPLKNSVGKEPANR